MDKYSIVIGKEKINFGIDNIKLLLGNNYIKKDKIINVIKKCFYKEESSEYSLENDLEYSFKINDKDFNNRQYELFEINNTININEETKLKAKSIFTKLIEVYFDDIEYSDIVNTLNILNKDLAHYMNEKLDELITQFKFNLNFEELIIKNIIKNLSLKLIIEESNINHYDLSYNERIISQIELCNAISKKVREKNFIGIVEIPVLTNEIFDSLKKITSNNIKMIVCSPEEKLKFLNFDIKDILFINDNSIDLSDENEIYNKINLNLNTFVSIEEMKNELYKYFINESINLKLEELL